MKRTDRQTHSLTAFMPADERDYLLPSRRYIAFENGIVSFLCKQNVIQPNHITYFRFLICFVLLFWSPSLTYLQIFVLALLGALSDFFDGALARAASKKTRLGMMIDPLADKCLVFALVAVLLMRHVIHPVYLLLMLAVEAHVVVIPLLSWFCGLWWGKKKRAGRTAYDATHSVFMVKSRDIVLGKIKMFLYASAFLCLLMGKVLNSGPLLGLAEGLLVSGIGAAAMALFLYLLRWIRSPYRIAGL
jgi:phosphatidylglycerophosphate synthase